jgi:hypothetical protein
MLLFDEIVCDSFGHENTLLKKFLYKKYFRCVELRRNKKVAVWSAINGASISVLGSFMLEMFRGPLVWVVEKVMEWPWNWNWKKWSKS